MYFDEHGQIIAEQLIDYPSDAYQPLREKALKCQRCHLRQNATQVVMGQGAVDAKIMFIGEGPGRDEDLQGKPFVGKAGQLLDKIFASVGIDRSRVYITNMVKCRPPQNRNPKMGEIEACSPILKAEIKIIDPKVIVLLGSVALKSMIAENASIMKMRGKWIQIGDRYILPTYHPAFLLRNPARKKEAWLDFQLIKKAIERIEELKAAGKL